MCELGGESLLESWMVRQAGLGGASGSRETTGPKTEMGVEKSGRRGGLGVWYETKGESIVKGEETDFIATAPIPQALVWQPQTSLLNKISNLVYSVPTDTLNDITEAKKSLPIRHSLIREHPRIRMLSTHRDAHIYIFPAWVLDMINRNEHMDSIGEDVIGWWAKAGWQKGLAEKLSLDSIFNPPVISNSDDNLLDDDTEHDNIDYANLSTTATSDLRSEESKPTDTVVPPILAYIHPKDGKLIRRVDTAPLLLSVSLALAKLESITEVGKEAASPFAHVNKVSYPKGITNPVNISRPDCLLAANVIIEPKVSIKECVVGNNCQIKTGARLTRCVLMDGVVVGKNCKLTGCILGKRSVIGEESILTDCEVQENLLVEPHSKFLVILC